MDNHQESEQHVSQYPDPEQSGLNFPWLDQYQPVAAEHLSTVRESLSHGSSVSQGDAPTSTSRYNLRDRRRSSLVLAEDVHFRPSAVLEDSEGDPEFLDTDGEVE